MGSVLDRERAENDPALTPRSVLASMLLGSTPPKLPVAVLVRVGERFGFSEGSVRTALSRMTASGELSRDTQGWYALQGDLLTRQFRQGQSRSAVTTQWSGRWRIAIVDPGARSAPARAALRTALIRLRFAEQREGVWMRPDNLDPRSQTEQWLLDDAQCRWFLAEPEFSFEQTELDFVAGLWGLSEWESKATQLRKKMHALTAPLKQGDTSALASGFVLSAAVLRHFIADPLLPRELLPRHWPGAALRTDYDRYDQIYRSVLDDWVRAR